MDIPDTLCEYEPEFIGYCNLLTEYPLNVKFYLLLMKKPQTKNIQI
jgi:hypothetical protein